MDILLTGEVALRHFLTEVEQMAWISDFMDAQFRREREKRRLDELELEMQSARIKGIGHCIKCGFCCHRRTCMPTPDEVETIADFLKMDVKELVKEYFAVDVSCDVYFLRPLGVNILDLGGEFIPSRRTYNEGKCVFLDEDNLCSIYPVRPETARQTECWKEDDMDFMGDIRKAWSPNKLKSRFRIDGRILEEGAD